MKKLKHFISVVIIITMVLFLVSCTKSKPAEVQPSVETTLLMGTVIKITIFDKVESKVFEQAFARIEDIENKMSINKEDSEILRLNNKSGIESVKVSFDTFYVLEKGEYYSELTEGLFDITIGPLVKLWNIGSEEAKVPKENIIKEKIELIDYNDLKLDKNEYSAKLVQPNMIVDLGAIAKGYAADEAKMLLEKNNIKSAIINLGGNILALGQNPDGSPFRLGLQDPNGDRNDYIGIYYLKDEALVTSGIYERYFEEDGKRYHHILNPKTGYPEDNELASVSIITPKSIDADGLSTCIFLLGLNKGIEMIENLPHVEAVFITRDKKVYKTSGVGDKFKITDEDYRLAN